MITNQHPSPPSLRDPHLHTFSYLEEELPPFLSRPFFFPTPPIGTEPGLDSYRAGRDSVSKPTSGYLVDLVTWSPDLTLTNSPISSKPAEREILSPNP